MSLEDSSSSTFLGLYTRQGVAQNPWSPRRAVFGWLVMGCLAWSSILLAAVRF
jgi:hypothetical protein